MVRRTKADAEITRQQLLDAAEHVFADKGVSRTSLQDIAAAAGTTRGAIYWHFDNKAALFNAMMDRVTLPMEQAQRQIGHDPRRDPLDELVVAMLDALRQIATDARTRRVFEVATFKVEYVDELLAVRDRHLQAQTQCLAEIERSLKEATARRAVVLAVPLAHAAQGLHALMVGLIQSWLMAPDRGDLEATGAQTLRIYLRGLGF